MRVIPFIILLLISLSFSDTVTQTDWSGGGGVPWPVTDWSNRYDVAYQINDTGSSLRLVSLKHSVEGSFDGVCSICAADVDGDGDIDVLGAAYYGNAITWWENPDCTGSKWTEHTVDGTFNRAHSVYAADVDGDGDTDVLGAAYFADDITWWENKDGTGTSWTEHTVDGSFDGAQSVYAADVNGDGDMDILGAAHTADEITWWENPGGSSISWVEHTVDGSFGGATSVYAADVDGDGDTDVLGAAKIDDDITWWENSDGTGTSWTQHTVDGAFEFASSIFATDVDGDGDTDVLGTACSWTDEITWWENDDGSGTSWTEHLIDGFFDDPHSVYAADIDGDGDMDVLGAANDADAITWWENTDGSGISWIEHTLDCNFNGACAVYAADVDGDGDTDVLGAAVYANDIAWWDGIDFSPTGTLESSILNAGYVDLWELFTSNEEEPSGTSVGFQFRSSDNPASMGAWSDTVFTSNTDLSDILVDPTDYVQYRVILQTTDPASTPVLHDVAISYITEVSIGDTNLEEIPHWDFAPTVNPSFGNLTIQLTVPHSEIVDLILYDLTGRVISEYSQEIPTGTHSVSFHNLAEGVYYCTIHAGNFEATEQVVVLK